MFSTGRLYGLTINSVVDERRDPIKSTRAAARYLKDLYNIFNDWTLVIAAYNCGPGNVTKAIRRSGNQKDYWQIYYRLPMETRGYLPQYVAAVYAVNYFMEHNIKPMPVNIPIACDTIMVNKDIHLSQISEVMGLPLDELRALNPQYRTGLVPGSARPMSLTLPMEHIGDFIDLHDTIANFKRDLYLNKNTRIVDPVRSSYAPTDVKGKTRIYYTVKDGDNLGYISAWFRVPLADLRSWNNIYRNSIRVGQRLVVYVDPARAEYYSDVSKMSYSEKQASVGGQTSVSKAATESEGEFVIYSVRQGDTLWDIAKFFGVTTSEVLSWNGITDPKKIKAGQKLKIRRKS